MTFLTNHEYQDISHNIDNYNCNINDVLEQIETKLKLVANCCVKSSRVRNATQPLWFDNMCKQLKKDKNRLLRKYRNNRTDVNLENFKTARTKFKAECDRKHNAFKIILEKT